MHTFTKRLAGLFIILLATGFPTLTSAAATTAFQQCVTAALLSGEFENYTVAELRAHCTKTSAAAEKTKPRPLWNSLIGKRLSAEEDNHANPFSLTAHRRNYLLPITYNSNTNGQPFSVADDKIKNIEVKFQFSFKFPIWDNLIGNGDLWGAYTNLSFWQAYNDAYSSPFRDTNHEPEIFLRFENDGQLFGLRNTCNSIGLVHQSNGQGGALSRSWNRIYLQMALEGDNFTLTFKPWYRIPEQGKDSASDAKGDDNPDIEKYLGYGEIQASYKWQGHLFSVLWRNNLRRSENKGAVQLDWTFALTERLKGYLQYTNGYGESLIDYNAAVNRIGFGIILTDVL